MSTASPHDIGTALFVDRFEYTPKRTKSLFLWLDEAFNRLGVVPSRLSAGQKYRTYRGLRPRLLKSDFADIKNFSIQSLPPDREEFRGWKSEAGVGRRQRTMLHPDDESFWRANWMHAEQEDLRWTAKWILFAADSGYTEDFILREMIQFAGLAMDEYGYIGSLKRGTEPSAFDTDVIFPGDSWGDGGIRTRDLQWNRFTWTRFGCWTKRLLRDTFPVNFLGRSYLDLPIEGTTLERWILADPLRRGTIEPLNGRVWVWKPVAKWIPFIREPLFRAGLLHWWGMFSIDDFTQLQVKEPFVPPAETPEMFRPEFYAGRDPSITR